MTLPGQQRCNDVLKIFKEANSVLTKENQHKKAQQLWDEVKLNSKCLANTIRQLNTKAAKRHYSAILDKKQWHLHWKEKNKGKKLTNNLAPTPTKIHQQLS